ncbi:hypothetical protein KAU88_07595 [Candidatus Bathyarchaeota archaeon]|nr:hypothetical protein [Candidatus Bathyarchaeota archaeon]
MTEHSEKITLEKKLTIERPFTTEPKTRRKNRKLGIVKRRVIELRESFFPTVRVPYVAVVRRMKQMCLCDCKTILNYLGRTDTVTKTVIDHTVKYEKSGQLIPKKHTFRRTLHEQEGYIAVLEQGHLEKDGNGSVSVVWNHQVQTDFLRVLGNNNELVCGSKNFSLSPLGEGNEEAGESLVDRDMSTTIREYNNNNNLIGGERKKSKDSEGESESNRLSDEENMILEAAKKEAST